MNREQCVIHSAAGGEASAQIGQLKHRLKLENKACTAALETLNDVHRAHSEKLISILKSVQAHCKASLPPHLAKRMEAAVEEHNQLFKPAASQGATYEH